MNRFHVVVSVISMRSLRQFMAGMVLICLAMQSSAESRIGYIALQTNLMATASPASEKLSQLKQGDQVVVEGRKGGWYQVSSDNQTGWVKFVSVRFQQGDIKGSSGISETAKLLTQGTTPTLTAGVKGLQEEDLQNAEPNLVAVALMETFAVTSDQAIMFAKEQRLRGAK